MARDRKRAKQRRERQSRSTGQRRHADGTAAHEHEPPELASGDLDIADAHLAFGRPELADAAATDVPDVVDDEVDLPELADDERFEALEDRVDDAEERFEEGSNGHAADGAEVVRRRRRSAHPAERREGNRFANFLRGSWRELQRVQWPDRQAVGQATAVVIGFVIVAGAFLGLMDFFASKIVDLIV
ncbi:MAG: preprotein translocase subunit SecE [Conexibacter sp.]